MGLNRELIAPNAEANSMIIHTKHKCSYGKCSYCHSLLDSEQSKFRISQFKEFLKKEADRYINEEVSSVFLAHGNTLGMEVKQVLSVLKAIKEQFPSVTSISAYGSARSIRKRSDKDLSKLREAGLTRVHLGFESGSDEVLDTLNKGVSSQDLLEAATRLVESEFELYLYVLAGSGGKALSEKHIASTSQLINRINPSVVEFHTLVLIPGTKLYELAKEGKFIGLSPTESIYEIKSVISGIDVDTYVNCSHISNYCHVNGDLQAEKARMLKELDYCHSLSDEEFKNAGITNFTIPEC